MYDAKKGLIHMSFQPGSPCSFNYKSGSYIGQFVELSARSNRAVVRIVAVLEHPMQGDLHHPYETDVPLFHERKASAYGEQVLVPYAMLEAWHGDLPEYRQSLRDALDRLIADMVKAIYRDTDPRLHGAAALSVLAHLEDLVARGEVVTEGPPSLRGLYFPAPGA